jgi:hypothetical protein
LPSTTATSAEGLRDGGSAPAEGKALIVQAAVKGVAIQGIENLTQGMR